jgi:hypothetical protein
MEESRMRERVKELHDLLQKARELEASTRFRFVREPSGKLTIGLREDTELDIHAKQRCLLELLCDIEGKSAYRLIKEGDTGEWQWDFQWTEEHEKQIDKRSSS